MPVGPERRVYFPSLRSGSGWGSGSTLGLRIMQTVLASSMPMKSERRNRILGVCTICSVMFGNGVETLFEIGSPEVLTLMCMNRLPTEYSEGAVGTTNVDTVNLRAVSAAIPATALTTWAFALLWCRPSKPSLYFDNLSRILRVICWTAGSLPERPWAQSVLPQVKTVPLLV